eukprot:1589191-Ditylum_brightwellii.AAC.1
MPLPLKNTEEPWLGMLPKDEEKRVETIHPNSIKEMESTTGPDSEVECKQLKAEEGFSYQAPIDKLIFANVICHPDVGYTVVELSEFSTMPVQCHYKAVKCVFCYLCQTKEWGLIYWRQEPCKELPVGKHTQQSLNESNLRFIGPKEGHQLGIYVDAAHATDLKCYRSIVGQAALFDGTAIAYLEKWQITVATSSTEAEFFK